MIEYSEKERRYIEYVLRNREELIPIFDNPLKVPQQVKSFDNNAFVVFNNRKNRYELHSLESFYQDEELYGWSTYQADLYYDNLDERVLEYMYENSLKIHSTDLMDNLDYEYEMMEKQNNEVGGNTMKIITKRVINSLKGVNTFY